MGNAFEEAMHQGYSAADLSADMEEFTERLQEIGCFTCIYRERNSSTCSVVLNEDKLYPKCPYRKEA